MLSTASTGCFVFVLLFAFAIESSDGSSNWGVKQKVTITNQSGGLSTTLFGKPTPGAMFGDRFGWRVKSLGALTEDGPSYLAASALYFDYYHRTAAAETFYEAEGAVILMQLNETGHVVNDYPFLFPDAGTHDDGVDTTLMFGLGMEVIPDWDGDERPELLVADMDEWGGPGKVRWISLDEEGAVQQVQSVVTSGQGNAPSLPWLGMSSSTLGDVNGDGYEDVAFGTPDDANPPNSKVYIGFFGANHTLVFYTYISDPSGSPSGTLFGTSVAGLGDIDGDSVPDMAVRVAGKDDGLGTVLIIRLTAAGNIKAWHELFLSDFVSEAEYAQRKVSGDKSFGYSLSTLCNLGWGVDREARSASADWNHDGVPDLAVGCHGMARVFLAFLSTNGTVKHFATIQGEEASFGTAVAPLGDLNKDGIPDLAVANYLSQGDMGAVYIHLLDSLIVSISDAPDITEETITFVVQLSSSPQQEVSLPINAIYEGPNENVAFTIEPAPVVFASNTTELSIEVVITAINFTFDGAQQQKRQSEGLVLSFGQPTNAFFDFDFALQLSFAGSAIVTEPPPDNDGSDGGDGTDGSNSESNEQGGNKSSNDGVGAEVIAPVVVVSILLVLAVAAIVAVVVVRRRMAQQQNKKVEDLESGMDDLVYASPSGQKAGTRKRTRKERNGEDGPTWEIDFDELEFQEEIGRGAFGVVWRAIWRDSEVAVKKLNGMDEHELEDFRAEALVMKGLRPHANVVQLYGVCSGEDTPKCIVTEFMQMGNLLSYLREHPDSIDSSQMIQWAIDIAAGLRHLHQEGITHRDLAARNLLLTKQLNVKVSDFGLSRKREVGESEAQKTTTEVGPLKWMSPEAISELEYSEKSDVWSYGVCLWEIVTKGEEPFDGLNVVKAAIEICEKGTRLTIPQDAPKVLATIINQCWALSPKDRPTFAEIASMLKKASK
ncbi:Serine/threonine-protein kinase svkA [Balamuthia mandrillaris]